MSGVIWGPQVRRSHGAERSLLSRNAFEALVAFESRCAERYGHRHAVLELDLPETDLLLRSTVLEALAARLRSVDAVGRLSCGGIGVLVMHTDADEVLELTTRLEDATGGRAASRDWKVKYLEGSGAPTPRDDWRLDLEGSSDLGPAGGGVALRQRSRTRVRSGLRASGKALECPPAGVLQLLSQPLPRGKRALDILVAGAGLLLLAPLMGLIAALVASTSKGPVLFRQERTGMGLRRFRMFKFRTMTHDSEGLRSELGEQNEMTGPLFKMQSDPRRTFVGRFLRKLSLDELPQLWNVLRGDMTLIGPRALSPKASQYELWQLRRFDVKPGLACTWQAESRGSGDFTRWMRSDLGYIDAGVTFRSDARIFLRTAWAVLTCSGSR